MKVARYTLAEEESPGRFLLNPKADNGFPACYLYSVTDNTSFHTSGPGEFNKKPQDDDHIPVQASSLSQIHSKRVVLFPEQYSPDLPGDGLVTDRRDARLKVSVADCLPIFLYIKDAPVFGVVHSGWRGTGIVVNAVNRLCQLSGRTPNAVHALIGPGIGVCCYAVERSRTRLFSPTCSIDRDGTTFLDLQTANLEILQDIGVEFVDVIDTCTSCDTRLRSFRREGAENYRTMSAVIGYF